MRRAWLVVGFSIWACASLGWAGTTTSATRATEHHATVTRWSAQELNGTVSMVDPQQNLLVVCDSSGVPFDLRIRPSTRIDSGPQAVNLAQLTKNESVSVRYIPEATGDFARSIQVQH